MQILQDPEQYAFKLVGIFGSTANALKAFNEARNSDDGHIAQMPQEWCIDVAEHLGAWNDEGL